MTQILDTSYISLIRASDILRSWGLVAFPTETVYGLGANGLDAQAVAKIFVAKGRPQDNPLILHVSCSEDFDRYAKNIPEYARKLIDVFCPGPLTFVFEKSDIVPDMVTAWLSTVCLRIPHHTKTLDLLDILDFPLAGPSANRSGRPSPTSASHVIEDLDGRIDAVIDWGDTDIGIESTVLDCTGHIPVILREWCITWDMIDDILWYTMTDTVTDSKKSPGTRYRHYAPDLPIILTHLHQRADILHRISTGESVALLFLDSSIGTYNQNNIFAFDTMEDISHGLFRIFRECEKKRYTTLYIEKIPLEGIGRALMNRIEKAASGA